MKLLIYLLVCGLASVSAQTGPADPVPIDGEITDSDEAEVALPVTSTPVHTVWTGVPGVLPEEDSADESDPAPSSSTVTPTPVHTVWTGGPAVTSTTVVPTISKPDLPEDDIPEEAPDEIPGDDGEVEIPEYEDVSGSGEDALPTFGAGVEEMKNAMDRDTCDGITNKNKLWLCEKVNYMIEAIKWMKAVDEWRAGCLESEGEESISSTETCLNSSLVRCKNETTKRCITYGNGCEFCHCADFEYKCPSAIRKEWGAEMLAYQKRRAMYKMITAKCTRIGSMLDDECAAEDEDGEDDESGDGSGEWI